MATAPQPNRLMDIINSIARGAPQAVTGFVDLAGLPFTASGLLDPKQVVGSTAYLTDKGLLPQPSQSLLGQSVEAISGGLMPLSPTAMRATQAGIEATGKALAPKAGLLVEDYIRSMGGMTNVVPMNAAKSVEDVPKAMAIYHGTSPEAAASIAKRGFNVNKSADGSIWFTENPNIGEVSATGKGAVVKRILEEDKLRLATPEQADKYFIDQLISEGYDGVKYPGYGAEGFTHYQIFDPKKLSKETKTKKITEKVEGLLD